MRRHGGFTLLEVLLATSLLAAGIALAFATLRAAAATTERGEAIVERNERMRAVSEFLRRRIGAAQGMVFELDTQGGAPKRFEGNAQGMRFVADLPDYLGRGGPHLHALRIAGGGRGMQLDVAFHMVQSGEALPAIRPPEPLADGLSGARFAYRTVAEDGQPLPWQDNWEQVDAMPLQVRVQIADERGAWPDMVVSLPVAGSYTASEVSP